MGEMNGNPISEVIFSKLIFLMWTLNSEITSTGYFNNSLHILTLDLKQLRSPQFFFVSPTDILRDYHAPGTETQIRKD